MRQSEFAGLTESAQITAIVKARKGSYADAVSQIKALFVEAGLPEPADARVEAKMAEGGWTR